MPRSPTPDPHNNNDFMTGWKSIKGSREVRASQFFFSLKNMLEFLGKQSPAPLKLLCKVWHIFLSFAGLCV